MLPTAQGESPCQSDSSHINLHFASGTIQKRNHFFNSLGSADMRNQLTRKYPLIITVTRLYSLLPTQKRKFEVKNAHIDNDSFSMVWNLWRMMKKNLIRATIFRNLPMPINIAKFPIINSDLGSY
jgi:hypothetical protein